MKISPTGGSRNTIAVKVVTPVKLTLYVDLPSQPPLSDVLDQYEAFRWTIPTLSKPPSTRERLM